MSNHLLSFLFNRSATSGSQAEIPEIYSFPLAVETFIQISLETTYRKILIDTFERTHGLDEELEHLLWDNCVQSENSKGLISFLVDAMIKRSDLFLVYLPSVDVLRKADSQEQELIKKDYAVKGYSDTGVFISFKQYQLTEILKLYAALELCIFASFHKNVNLAKAVQIKMNDLRGSVALGDSSVAIAQAQSIADALRRGQDVLVDKQDDIVTAMPNITPTEKAIGFLDGKRSFALGLPLAYINGEMAGGIGDSGKADMRAIERGLKVFFFSIVKPTLKALFDIDVNFKTQDIDQTANALEAVKTFDLVSDDYISLETKRQIVWRMFDIDSEVEQERLEAEAKVKPKEQPEVEDNEAESF